MKRVHAVLAMIATAVVFLIVSATIAQLAREGSMSWSEASDFIDSFASLSCITTGFVIGIHLSTKPAE